MTRFSTIIGLIAVAAVGVTPVIAQTVSDDEVPTTSLDIPGNVKLYGDAKPNVYRPSATVNGEIITSTDIAQRMARSEEHTPELQSLMRTSYAVFCLQKKKLSNTRQQNETKHK